MKKAQITFDAFANRIDSLDVKLFDTGSSYAEACLKRTYNNNWEEVSVYGHEFFSTLEQMMKDGSELSDFTMITAANNLCYFRVAVEYDEKCIEQYKKDAAQHWKDRRAVLRQIEKEKKEDDERKQLEALANLGIDRSTLRKVVDGKLDIPPKKTGSGIQPAMRFDSHRKGVE